MQSTQSGEKPSMCGLELFIFRKSFWLMFLLGWVKELQSGSSKARTAWGRPSKASGHSNQVWDWENNPFIHRDLEMRSELVLGCWVWCTRGFGVVHPGTVSGRWEPMLENGRAPQMIPVTHSHSHPTLHRRWDEGVPALTVQDFTPGFLSHTSHLPSLHLPEWYLSRGKSHFHPFNCTGRSHPTEVMYSTMLIWLIQGRQPSGHHS